MKKKCEICGSIEKPGNIVITYTLLNGSEILVDKDCLNINVLNSFFDENGGEGIDLELASKVLKDQMKKNQIKGGASMKPWRYSGRRPK